MGGVVPSQLPVLVIQVRDHMGQEHIVCSLSPKEDTKSSNVGQEGAFHYGIRIQEKRHHFALDQLV